MFGKGRSTKTIEDIRQLVRKNMHNKNMLLSCVQGSSPVATKIVTGDYDLDDAFNILTGVSRWIPQESEEPPSDWTYPAQERSGGMGHREYADNDTIYTMILERAISVDKGE